MLIILPLKYGLDFETLKTIEKAVNKNHLCSKNT